MRWLGVPANSTELPGSGNRMSIPSVVVQPLMLATNMSGKSARFDRDMKLTGSGDAYLFAFGGCTMIGAQFIYISRFPIRLNHVHASVYFPGLMLVGIMN